jgi:hypothetical protein
LNKWFEEPLLIENATLGGSRFVAGSLAAEDKLDAAAWVGLLMQ